MNKEQLIKNIASLADKWDGLTIEKQEDKVFEEYNELLEAKESGDVEEIKKELADVIITMIVLHELINDATLQDWINVIDVIQESKKEHLSFEFPIGYYILTKLGNISSQFKLNPWECLEYKYNIVAKREGKVINGTFVKNINHGK